MLTSLAGWGPELEINIALSSMGQDEIGHARRLYGLVAGGPAATERLVYERPGAEFLASPLARTYPTEWEGLLARQYLYETADAARAAVLAKAADPDFGGLVTEMSYGGGLSPGVLVGLAGIDGAHLRGRARPGAAGLRSDVAAGRRVLPAFRARARGRARPERAGAGRGWPSGGPATCALSSPNSGLSSATARRIPALTGWRTCSARCATCTRPRQGAGDSDAVDADLEQAVAARSRPWRTRSCRSRSRTWAWCGRSTVAGGQGAAPTPPTFLACPALWLVESDVTAATLAVEGVTSCSVEWVEGGWSASHVTDAGRAALADIGVAIPGPDGTIRCPFLRP